MRAKEYINLNKCNLQHAAIIIRIIDELLPLRSSKEDTATYMNTYLFADTRYQHYLLKKDLFERGVAIQSEKPVFDAVDGEVDKSIARQVRDELFRVIQDDASFGYLYFILGSERNSCGGNKPVDCVPNATRILESITENRDDYPKTDLDDFVNEDLNYQQYNLLMQGHYWDDSDELYLSYFNRVYNVYDELRLRRHSVKGMRAYLSALQFDSDVQKYWTLAYIVTLIDQTSIDDLSFGRCRQELLRITEPLKPHVVKDSAEELWNSPVHLSPKKGNKLNFIRVFYALHELGLFEDENGGKLTKKDLFATLSDFLNIDLTSYDKDLSNSMQSCMSLEKHTRIFEDMKNKIEEIFNSK